MTNRLAVLVLVAVIGSVLVACGSTAEDVPSLGATPTAAVEEDPLDDEEKMMAFTQCMRDEGIELVDAGVDADGNVGKPEFPAGDDKEAMMAAWEACEHHLAGFTDEQERKDMSEVVDQYVAFATCMRDKGYDIEDPTTETLDQWGADWKNAINWDNPDALADYEDCSGETFGKDGGK